MHRTITTSEGRQPGRVLVIGARGVLGALTARAFADAGWQVRRGAREPGTDQTHIDLDRPDLVAAALDERELVVNTVPHQGLLAERLVLERGGALINTSALPAAAGRSLRATAGAARGTVLMNAGLAPGVTTVVADDVLRSHPEADRLEIVFTLSTATPRGPASVEFLRRGLTAVERHPTTIVALPQPFGPRRCLGFGEGDAGWLGGAAEGRLVRHYLCIAELLVHERMLELNSAGAMTELPTSWIGPHELGIGGAPGNEPVAHWIAARRGERLLEARIVRCRGDYLHAARSTVVMAEELLSEQRRGGCFDPEELFTLPNMEPQLRGMGISIAAGPPPAADAHRFRSARGPSRRC